ncbi:hypothetical protein [Dyadobacter sp. CY356]|uniref:hypothetical protein n=1 Tax=Dyadobacter sp. CY356 TaxID=2906442 RepID=UPI001F30DD75|nr:hypothetical protein [Dyadobacter sp. CY356]MCF0057080.1 hypothetical protein [Dyadobacter sp. CY356]
MEEKNYSGTIPAQEDGSKINVESSVDVNSEEQAKALFQTAKSRLLDVNNWHDITGKMLAEFQLTDSSGNQTTTLQEGTYFKIDIPGPGSNAGDGFDWVKVEKIDAYTTPDIDSIGIRVRPASNPLSTNTDIAHFYSQDSTSTFTITREATKVTAGVYDRNTKTNKDSEQLPDQLRNAVVGIGGIITFSRIQWKSLTDAIIKQAD